MVREEVVYYLGFDFVDKPIHNASHIAKSLHLNQRALAAHALKGVYFLLELESNMPPRKGPKGVVQAPRERRLPGNRMSDEDMAARRMPLRLSAPPNLTLVLTMSTQAAQWPVWLLTGVMARKRQALFACVFNFPQQVRKTKLSVLEVLQVTCKRLIALAIRSRIE